MKSFSELIFYLMKYETFSYFVVVNSNNYFIITIVRKYEAQAHYCSHGKKGVESQRKDLILGRK